MSKVIQTSLNFLLGKESSEKKTSKNFETKMNSVSKFNYKFLAVFVGISSFLALPLVSISSAHASSSFEYQVQVNTSLNVAVSSPTVSLTLNPSITPFASTDLDVTVGTNNPWGYRLYINADSTDLLNDTYADDAYINTLSSSATESTFTANKWGYRISKLSTGVTADDSITDTDTKTNFYPFVSDTLVGQTSVPSNEANTKLTFGAKVNYERPAGVYTLDFTFRTVPTVTTLSMQDLDGDVCTTTPTIVTDSRDGQSYAIARLEDGKCWMLQNLKLGKNTDSITLTDADTNLAEGGSFVLDNKRTTSSTPVMPGETVVVDGTNVHNVYDHSAYLCTDDYGCYYNWYTATAGSGTAATISSETSTVDYSICPAGWTLPTAEPLDSDWTNLMRAYGLYDGVHSSAEVAEAVLVADPTTTTENINGQYIPGFLLGAFYNGGGVYRVGTGAYWSKTPVSSRAQAMVGGFYLNGSTGIVTVGSNKMNGNSIRCLLSES